MRMPRVYPILDTAALARRGCGDWPSVARAMLAGGAAVLQLRHKGDWTREVLTSAEEVASACDRSGVPFLVNDRADMAKLLGAGVHVGQDDLSPTDCRVVLGDERTVGFSTHNADQLAEAADLPIDYVAFGPIFVTASKDNPDPVTGLERLRQARPLVFKPLVAIGGISLRNAQPVFDAGADSIALINDLLPETLNPRAISQRMEEWQRRSR